MKAIALALCLCFSLNVLAAHGTIQELEKTFDNYTYAVTVEWDQKDKAFHQEATKKLFSELDVMMKAGKVTKDDILTLAEKKIGNKKSLDAMKAKLTLMINAEMSAEEIASVLNEQSSQFYDRGASWSGEVYTIGGIVAVAALITFLIIIGNKSAANKCVQYSDDLSCAWYTDPNPAIPQRWECYKTCLRWE